MLPLRQPQEHRTVVWSVGDLNSRVQMESISNGMSAPGKAGAASDIGRDRLSSPADSQAAHRNVQAPAIDQPVTYAPPRMLPFQQVLVALFHPPHRKLRGTVRGAHARDRIDSKNGGVFPVQ